MQTWRGTRLEQGRFKVDILSTRLDRELAVTKTKKVLPENHLKSRDSLGMHISPVYLRPTWRLQVGVLFSDGVQPEHTFDGFRSSVILEIFGFIKNSQGDYH